MKRRALPGRTAWPLLFVSILLSNTLALTMPLVARQILALGGRAPHTSTILVLVAMVMAAAALESLIKCLRALILANANRVFMVERLHWLLDRVARGGHMRFSSAAAASVDYAGALQQLKGIASGEVDLVWAELCFVPVILLILMLLSPLSALTVLVFMLLLCVLTYRTTRRFSIIAEAGRAATEHRFERLFQILDRMHLVKALAVEQHMTRVYEQAHGAAMRDTLRLAMAATRLTHAMAIAGMALNLVLLITCAIAARTGRMDITLVISIVLLSSRLTDPIQRAVFTFVQGRDRRAALAKIAGLEAATLSPLADGRGEEPNGGDGAGPVSFEQLRLSARSLSAMPAPGEATGPVSLTIRRGDFVAISSDRPDLSRRLLRAMAGLEGDDPAAPGQADLRINERRFEAWSCAMRSRFVGYVPARSALFDGTIQDNVTRFGAVSVEQAFAVAELFGMARRLNELPGGLQTRVGSGARGNVPPGLERQIAILRALVHKPAVILFDHAEQGLDRDAYAGLVRFLGKVRGQATIVLASEDGNLTALADTCYALSTRGLRRSDPDASPAVAYRSLVV